MTLPGLVAPFAGERYGPNVVLDDVLSPPYDVLDDAARSGLAARDPYNVVHVILPSGNGDRYQRAQALLEEWRGAGVLHRDTEPSVYVVRQRFSTPDGSRYTRTGLIAAVLAEPFSTGRIKPHERTHAGPKHDRLALLRTTKTMCEALLMLARDRNDELREGLAQVTASIPLARAELDGVTAALWRVSGHRGDALAAAAGTEPLYLADGHHRFETAVAYRAENALAERTLALVVPVGDPGLVVQPTHRLVTGGPVSPETVQRGLTAHFVVEELPGALQERQVAALLQENGGECVLVLPGRAFRLTRRPGASPEGVAALDPSVRELDVAWVDQAVVPILQRAAAADGLRYTADAADAVSAVRRGDASAAVLLKAPAVEQVLAVADAGAVMPPKATFFFPKVPSGIVFLPYGAK